MCSDGAVMLVQAGGDDSSSCHHDSLRHHCTITACTYVSPPSLHRHHTITAPPMPGVQLETPSHGWRRLGRCEHHARIPGDQARIPGDRDHITTSLLYHRGTINVSSSVVTVPSLRHHCTITAPSLHLPACTLRARHTSVRSGSIQERQKNNYKVLKTLKNVKMCPK